MLLRDASWREGGVGLGGAIAGANVVGEQDSGVRERTGGKSGTSATLGGGEGYRVKSARALPTVVTAHEAAARPPDLSSAESALAASPCPQPSTLTANSTNAQCRDHGADATR